MKQEVRNAREYCAQKNIDTFARWIVAAALCQEYQRRSGDPSMVDWRVVTVPRTQWNIDAAKTMARWSYHKTRGSGPRVSAFGLVSFEVAGDLLVTVGNTLLEAYT